MKTNTTPSESQAKSPYLFDQAEHGLRVLYAQHDRQGANVTVVVGSPSDISLFPVGESVWMELTTEHGHKVRVEIHGITYNGFMRQIFED